MGDASLSPEHEVAYYTIANAAHYPGAVALLNSLRALGETAPLYVVDCGLTLSQRDALSAHARLVEPRPGLHPGLQKATAPLAHPAEIMVVLDADVIVNRPLTPFFADARLGRFVAFEERIAERFFPEWSELEIGDPSRQPYVSGGHFLLSAETGGEFFPLFAGLQRRLDTAAGVYASRNRTDPATDPYFYADQDLLNAVLCARYAGRVTRLDRSTWAFPPFSGLMLTDEGCVYPDGSAPYLLHHFWKKPWLAPLAPNVYSELFTRLVTDRDAPIRLGRGDIPLRLRASRLAPIDRWRAAVQREAHSRLRGKLGIRPVVEREVRKAVRRARGEAA
jgi:hypothetical protein